jgi:hypothetical protein
VTNGLVVAGNLTLPPKALAADNSAGYYTLQITDSNTSDTFFDVLHRRTRPQVRPGAAPRVAERPAPGHLRDRRDPRPVRRALDTRAGG